MKNLGQEKNNLTKFFKSFKYCYDGIKYAIFNEQNIMVEIILGITAITLGLILKVNITEMIIIILLCAVVIALEIVNTAIERVVDLVTKEQTELAKIAKDCASGAVGIVAIAAFIIGIIIFVPKLLALF